MFHYDKQYLQLPGAMSLDPVTLPLHGKIRIAESNNGLYGVFRDSTPDYWGRFALGKRLNIPERSLFEDQFLLYSDASRAGNLDFRKTKEDSEPNFSAPAVEKLDDLINTATLMEKGEAIPARLKAFLKAPTSMGGVRPKCLVEDGQGLWLAKFPSIHDEWDNAKVEFATMNLARACRIQIPDMRIEQIGKRSVLLLSRFDRIKTSAGYERIGYASALSVMGFDEKEARKCGYSLFLENIPGSSKSSIREELFRRMVFNILCRNIDDHARNHGILFDANNCWLSPAFDITPEPSAAGTNEEYYLQMDVGPRGRLADVQNALDGCHDFGLNHDQAVGIMRELAEVFQDWKDFFAQAGVTEKETDRFVNSFDSLQLQKIKTLGEHRHGPS